MLTVPRSSVRTSLGLAILITLILSWVISTGVANYFVYLNMSSLRQEMISHPDIYSRPIPEPRFGIIEFLTGRPPIPRGPGGPPPHPGMQPGQPGEPSPGRSGQPGPPQQEYSFWHSPEWFDIRMILLRFVVAIGLAVLTGAVLGRRFTTPLMRLARGAGAFHSGNFKYRIPTNGEDEFAAVATAMNDMASQVSEHITHLEEDAERRRQFLADLAHELRSPVTTMRTMAGALQDGVADDPVRRERAVSALVRTSERMLRLVQDLMVLAKLDLNELPLEKREVDLAELIASAVQTREADAAAAGLMLYPIKPTAPVKVIVDPDRITQVVDNILQNAICYAGSGAEIRVTIDARESVCVRIADTGKGIRAEDMPYIFDSFYRADAARTPGESHSGLGLRIARRLVEVHGGKLDVASVEGKGTTVTILLPRVL